MRSSLVKAMGRRKFFIDTDPGTDDALALLGVFAREDIEVVGISVAHGNGYLEDMAANVVRLLEISEYKFSPKLYFGSRAPILGSEYKKVPIATHFHGSDGLLDMPDVYPKRHSREIIENKFEKTSAWDGLIDISKTFSDLELVCLGAQTNLAMALRIDPSLKSRIKRCTIMGGNHLGVGNTTQAGEYNFRLDPEAAFITLTELNSLGENLVISTWESTWENTWSEPMHEKFLACVKNKEKLPFLEKLLSRFQNFMEPEIKHFSSGKVFSPICDAVAMYAAVEPESIISKELRKISVELNGDWTRGQMIVARAAWAVDEIEKSILKNKTENTLVMKMDQDGYLDFFMKGISI